MINPAFIIRRSRDGQYYFTLTAKNGQVMASSEMYASKAACETAIATVREYATMAETIDQSLLTGRDNAQSGGQVLAGGQAA